VFDQNEGKKKGKNLMLLPLLFAVFFYFGCVVNLFRSVHVFDFPFWRCCCSRVYGNLFATGMFSCGFPKE